MTALRRLPARCAAAAAIAAVLLLAACTATGGGERASSGATPGGVTVFGDIDASVGRRTAH